MNIKKTIENAEELIKGYMKDDLVNPCDYCKADSCTKCSRYTENDDDELLFELDPVKDTDDVGVDYTKLYNQNPLAEIRSILENSYREQYNTACENSHLKWQATFKGAYERVIEGIADLDKLLK